MTEQSRIEIDQNGLSRCVAGKLVYEPNITAIRFPFPQRLARGGLRLDGGRAADGRTAQRCVRSAGGGAARGRRIQQRRVRIPAAVVRSRVAGGQPGAAARLRCKQAYDDLQLSQGAVMQQERLRALGQMASGIAHDINNAISPVSLYVDALLTHETGFSDRARKQLEIIQRAVDDVAHTVARMGEFYRQRQRLRADGARAGGRCTQAFREVLELTRARWSDMAQQRGAVIETKIEMRRREPHRHGHRERAARGADQPDIQCHGCDARRRHAHAAHRATRSKPARASRAACSSRSATPAPAWTRPRAAAAWSHSSPPRAIADRAWGWRWCTASPSAMAPTSTSSARRARAPRSGSPSR